MTNHIAWIFRPDCLVMMFLRRWSEFVTLNGYQVTRHFRENIVSKEDFFASKKVGKFLNQLCGWTFILVTPWTVISQSNVGKWWHGVIPPNHLYFVRQKPINIYAEMAYNRYPDLNLLLNLPLLRIKFIFLICVIT